MEKDITDELIKKAIIMALANMEMEEDFQFDEDKDFFLKPKNIEQKVKKKVFNYERHMGWLFNRRNKHSKK